MGSARDSQTKGGWRAKQVRQAPGPMGVVGVGLLRERRHLFPSAFLVTFLHSLMFGIPHTLGLG